MEKILFDIDQEIKITIIYIYNLFIFVLILFYLSLNLFFLRQIQILYQKNDDRKNLKIIFR